MHACVWLKHGSKDGSMMTHCSQVGVTGSTRPSARGHGWAGVPGSMWRIRCSQLGATDLERLGGTASGRNYMGVPGWVLPGGCGQVGGEQVALGNWMWSQLDTPPGEKSSGDMLANAFQILQKNLSSLRRKKNEAASGKER